MKDLFDVFQALSEAKIPTLLVIAGIIFLILAFTGGFGDIVRLPSKRQVWVGVIGFVLLVLGIGIPAYSPPNKSPTASPSQSPGPTSPPLSSGKPTTALGWSPELSATPIKPSEATPYLEKVFTLWTISGYLGDYPQVLSAFHSLLVLNGDNDPVGTMQSWIEEAKQMAVDAIPGSSLSDYKYFEFNLSLNYESLGLEESYYVLWEHVYHDPVVDNKPSLMASIRLALIASVGEARQQELIGDWNKLIAG